MSCNKAIIRISPLFPSASINRSRSSDWKRNCRNSPKNRQCIVQRVFSGSKEHCRGAVFPGGNNRFTIYWDRLWEKEESRLSQLVFIGKDLDRSAIETVLRRSLA